MGVCCVDGCESDDGEETVYFPVPVAPALRRKWRDAIRPTVKLHSDSRICSRHFHTSDYEHTRGKLRLKGRVVPSLFHNKNEKKQSSPKSSPQAPKSPRASPERGPPQSPNGAQDGPKEPEQEQPEIGLSVPEFGLLAAERANEGSGEGEDSAECTTIECVPEAVLPQDTDSHSETETHNGDIEDIIANYHIQQHRLLRAARERDDSGASGTEDNTADSKEKQKPSEEHGETKTPEVPPDRERTRRRKRRRAERDKDSNSDDDIVEVAVENERRPQFIELSVDAANGKPPAEGATGQDDCLIVLEKVEVELDPASLMLPQTEMEDQEQSDRREDPISLVTSSDESDVIIEEPHIDTVEVSSETDEDDRPLVSLVKSKEPETKLTRLLWGNLVEYYCYQCKFTTLSKGESERHKLQHSKILLVCPAPACDFTCTSSSQLSRHRKKHREEKKHRCQHCDYRARHSMSLVYHMKSHEGVHAEAVQVTDLTGSERYRCEDCRYCGDSRNDLLRHRRTCGKRKRKNKKNNTHKCGQCSYTTKRRSDLRRHRDRKHAASDEYED